MISHKSRIDLSFGLGKAYEDIKDYDLAFENYLNGNAIKRKQLNYSIEHDKILFNDLKNNFNKEIFKKFKNHSDSNDKIIFILGMPRSGTTLVEQILASHPKIYGAGELNNFNILVRKNLIYNNKLYITKNFSELNNSPFKKIGEEYLYTVNKFLNNKKLITDKTPINFLWIGVIKIVFPNAKIIHCIRNPKDNCFSIFKNYFAGTINFAYNLDEIVTYYNLYSDLMKFWRSIMPDSIYEIHYERLIDNQKEQTRNLLNFCELEWNDNCLLFYKNKRPIKTASSSQARKPIYKTSIESWKKFEKHLEKYLDKINS